MEQYLSLFGPAPSGPFLSLHGNSLSHGDQAVSIREIADQPLSADELDMLQRTFDRVCVWCSIPHYGKRAERVARHITDQFRKGMIDEAELFDSAMWLERNSALIRPDA